MCSALFKSPCQNACPIGMDVPQYLALVRAGRLDDAYKILLRTNPFPAICGRVCDHQCQSKCRRASSDEALAIKFVKRFITDNAKKPNVDPAAMDRKEKIAVVGSGPAGLTAAKDLALRGYKITVYEELPEAGGMTRYGIPSYRLPRNILAGEVNDIRALGVDIVCNTRVGRDVSFGTLYENFDYIYLAPGAHRSQRMGVKGENLSGVYGGVEFLRDFNMNEDAWLKGAKSLGSRVAVIGGGNSAIDAARCAVRLGADVTILYRRSREDMPAADEEILAALHEGIRIEYFVAPLEIHETNGKVSGISCERMKPGDFDKSGRRKPVPVKGSEFTLSVDAVIAAIGQAPDLSFVPEGAGIQINKWDTFDLAMDSKSRTTNAKFYAGGDAVTGPWTVVGAIAAGHLAAQDIDRDIRMRNGEPPWEAPAEEKIDIPFEIDEETVETPQAAMPELAAAARKTNFNEVELGYALDVAIKEASRCLRCDAEV
ncbi:MAG: FAD-dependent oxidoreductase [Deltaproteobacteria bacterium]|nr:FAD-dependent oxidoreductase [Deltaproteobacteria bacterium]